MKPITNFTFLFLFSVLGLASSASVVAIEGGDNTSGSLSIEFGKPTHAQRI